MTDYGPNPEPELAELPPFTGTAPEPNGEPDSTAAGNGLHAEPGAVAELEEAVPNSITPAGEALPPEHVPPSTPPRRPSAFAAGLQSLLITVVIAIFVITFIVQAFQIPSESMENTLLVGDYLLVDKSLYGESEFWAKIVPYREIQRNDIIVFRYPVNPEMHFVKRVVGIPGDHLRLRGGRLYVNGVLQHEPFAVYKYFVPDSYRDNFPNGSSGGPMYNANINTTWWKLLPEFVDHGEIIVPRGEYFALGDNRDQSLDSRYWGFVPRENIIGSPLVIYFSHIVPSETMPSDSNDKLARLVRVLRHLPDYVRWNRAMHVIH